MANISQYDEDGVKMDDFDPWEHLYEEDADYFGKIKSPKVKKMKKEQDFSQPKKKRRRNK